MIFEELIDMREAKWCVSMLKVVQDGPKAHARKLADDLELEGEERYHVLSTVSQIDFVKNCLAVAGAVAIATVPYICVKSLTR